VELTIIGAGAIGGTVGAFLTQTGHDITVVDVVPEHVDAINQHGLRISGVRGDHRYPLRAIHSDDLPGSLQNVTLAVKCHFTHSVVSTLIAPRLAKTGYVVSFQNGLNEQTISSIIGEERTVGAFVHFGADYLEPGHIQLGQEQDIFLGELDGSTTGRLTELQAVLSAVMPAHITDDIHGFLWGKLVYGSMAFAVSTVDAPVPDILADPVGKSVAVAACCETAAVASALGHNVRPIGQFEPAAFVPGLDLEQRAAAAIDRFRDEMAGSIKQHMGIWRDLKVRKRPTEVDMQCGKVVEYADSLGVDVPVNRAIVDLIHEIENGSRGMDWENLEILHRSTPGAPEHQL
jgi:2-dehydropantoate 2-reductase